MDFPFKIPQSASSYDDVALLSREKSTIASRDDCDPAVEAFEQKFSLPIMSSPMPDVTGGRMAVTLAELGLLPVIHRFMSVDKQVKEFSMVPLQYQQRVTCAIGVSDDFFDRFIALHKAGCTLFCLDTANGHHSYVETAISVLKAVTQDKIYFIAGNIATREGYRYLANLGVDAVRVGIAGGSVCTTRIKTGIYHPMVTCLIEVVDERFSIARERAVIAPNFDQVTDADRDLMIAAEYVHLPLIIADGGIREPKDMCAAIALGADFIMAGKIFAGTKETPGLIKRDGNKGRFKTYRGAASFGVQQEFHGTEPDYNEGEETLVPYKGPVVDVVDDFDAGIRSSMSYANARTLAQYRDHIEVIDI